MRGDAVGRFTEFFLFDSDRGVNCAWKKAGRTQRLLSGKRLVKVRGMKFVYVDEFGDQGQSDIFVMAGLLIDAYRLRIALPPSMR